MTKKTWKDLVFVTGLADIALRVAILFFRSNSYGLQRWIWSKIQEAALRKPIFSQSRSEALLLVDLDVTVVCFLARRVLWSKYPYVMSRTGSIFLFEDFDFSHFEAVPRLTPRKTDSSVKELMRAAVKAVDAGSLNCPTFHGLQHRERLKSLQLPEKRGDAKVLLERVIRQSIRYAANCLPSIKLMSWHGATQLLIPLVGDCDCEYRLHPELFVVLRFDGRNESQVYVPTILSREMVEIDTALPQEFLKKKAA